MDTQYWDATSIMDSLLMYLKDVGHLKSKVENREITKTSVGKGLSKIFREARPLTQEYTLLADTIKKVRSQYREANLI